MNKSKAILLFAFLSIGFFTQYTNILTPNGSNESSPLGVHKSDAWYDTGYLYKKQLTIDGSQVPGGSTLNNFPILVAITDSQLRTTANGGRVTNTNGYDIIFTDDAEGTKLSHEIESYDATTGTIKMWVKVLNLYSGSNTVLYVYYGNSSIGSTQENKTDVWSNAYAGVWHLGANLNDSTSNANNGTNVGATTGVAGKIGNAISSNGASGRVTVANHASLKPSNVTISAWVYRNGAQDSWGKVAFFGQNAVNPWGPYGIQFNNTSDTQLSGQIASSTTSYPINATSSTLNDLTWGFVAETYDGSTQKLYFNNDTPYSAVINVTIADYDSTNGLGIGGRYDGNSSQAFLGSIDEVRISNVARTAGWIGTEYNTVQNQGSGAGKFINSVGGEQTFPVPSVINYGAILVDDTTAVLTAGINSYGASSNGYFRYGISPTYTTGSACSSLPNTTSNSSSGNMNGNYYPRSAQVTGLTAGATYVFCFQSTSVGSPGYSTVTSFNMAATGSTGCSLFPGSGIANSADSTTVKGFLGTSKMQGTLLYKASVNGWTPTNFHTAVDNQGPTLIIIRNSANGKVFGAYAPKAWNSAGAWIPGAGALLFSITDNYKLQQLNYADYMILGQNLRGPYIGGGGNLAGPYNLDLNTSWGNTNNTSYWEQPSSQGAFTYLSGASSSFTPNEVEVYALSVCTAAAPTLATTPTHTAESYTTATLGGNVTSAGTQSVTELGVVVSLNPNPTISNTKFIKSPTIQTGVFTVGATGLTANTTYHYRAYATNSVGTSYSNDDTFTTLNNLPTGTDTSAAASVNSYYATLQGAANPNGFQTYGHFRVFTTNPGNCNTDAGGTRFPELQANDLNLGSGTSVVTAPTFQFTIPFNGSAFLVPGTNYWYCAYAVGTNGTGGASTVQPFITPDGPNSPCDTPTGGNFTMPSGSVCSLAGNFGGVDAGGGTTNTATLGVTGTLIVGAGQRVARGSMTVPKGSKITLAQGSSIIKGGIYVHDKDADGIIDDKTSYVGSTASASNEFVRRNTLSTVYNYAWKMASISGSLADCNPNNAYVNRYVPGIQMVTDADNDGYKTSAAPSNACVGAQSTINGRTYFKDTSNVSSWLPDAQKLSATTDCQDNPNGAPCVPTGVSATNPSSQTQNNITWSTDSNGGAVPAATGYDIEWCSGSNSCTGTQGSGAVLTNVTSTYNHTGRTAGTWYGYGVLAKNGAGSSAYSSKSYAQTAPSCTPQNYYEDFDGDGYGNGSSQTVTGWRKPGTVSNDASVGSQAWNNINNITTRNAQTEWNSHANASAGQSNYAWTTNYGFNIPSGATITGIEVGVHAYGGDSFYRTDADNIRLIKSGVVTGTSKSGGTLFNYQQGRYNDVTYGGAADMWGATLTPAEVNASNFGVAVSIGNSALGGWNYLESVRIRVNYTYSWNTTPTNVCPGSQPGGWVTNNSDCSNSESSRYQNLTAYPDGDGDQYGAGGSSSICSGASVDGTIDSFSSNSTDCYDSNANARQGQSGFFTETRGDGSWDYNCNTTADLQYTSNVYNEYGCSGSGASGYSNYTGSCSFTGGSGSCNSGAGNGPKTTCSGGWYMVPNYTDGTCSVGNGYIKIGVMPCN